MTKPEINLINTSDVNIEDATPAMQKFLEIKKEHPDAVLLYRNKESSLFLTNISQESRQHLQYVSKITIAEIQGDDVMREYVAPVHLIKDMRDILN